MVPKTYDDVVTWFTTPRKNETCGTHDESLLRELLSGMQTRPGLSAPMTPGTAWNLIIDHGLLYRDSRIGWVTREGVMLAVGYAAHDRLLGYLGIEPWDAEASGWVRLKRGAFQCAFKVTREQRLRIEEAGILVDDGAERLKPHWRKPAKVE